VAISYVTIVYFENLNTSGMRTGQVMQAIPASAAIIFEFNNDKSFYDIYKGNKLFAAVAGRQKLDELAGLQQQILLNPSFEKYFNGQNIFISLHPLKKNDIGFLFTIASINGFDEQFIENLAKQANSGLLITPFGTEIKQGFTVYIKALKKRFYAFINTDNILSGSFSRQLVDEAVSGQNEKGKPVFNPVSEKQNSNSLANLYVNFKQLTPLFYQLFKNKGTDIFENFRAFPALATLSINYRNDALMFNGSTINDPDKPAGYLNLFAEQETVNNHLKNILPSTTAYSTTFAVSSAAKFGSSLAQWQIRSSQNNEKEKLFNTIKAETGVKLKRDFYILLGNEFAVITTRYLEKFAVIAVSDGSKLKLLLSSLSKMTGENTGTLSYDKLPFFLLGDAFKNFRRPYFIVLDNYLILANTTGELASYKDSYINQKFLTKNEKYNQFDNLLAERGNVTFMFNFKNSMEILKRDLYPDVYGEFDKNSPGWKNFYGASCQLSSAGNNFYINFCFQLNSDSTETAR
jgi:hypothetical protein